MWTEKDLIGRKDEEQKDAPAVLHAVEPVPAGALQINPKYMTKREMTKEELERLKALFEVKDADRQIAAFEIPEPSVEEVTPEAIKEEEKVAEEKTEEVQEEIQEVGGFGLKMKVTRNGNEMLFTGLNYEAEKPAEKAEEPEVVPVDVPAEEKPAEAQERDPVEEYQREVVDLLEEEYKKNHETEPTEDAPPAPCPFCGAEIKLTYYKRWHVTGHEPSCILAPNFNVGKTKDQILEAWNRRR